LCVVSASPASPDMMHIHITPACVHCDWSTQVSDLLARGACLVTLTRFHKFSMYATLQY